MIPTLADLIARLEALDKAATPASEVEVNRYDHGGGRAFSRIGGEARNLVADFYSEADRECYLAARNELPRLLRLLRAGERAAEAIKAHSALPEYPTHCVTCAAALREWDEAAR